MYRFRSIDSLLEKYKELENQERFVKNQNAKAERAIKVAKQKKLMEELSA